MIYILVTDNYPGTSVVTYTADVKVGFWRKKSMHTHSSFCEQLFNRDGNNLVYNPSGAKWACLHNDCNGRLVDCGSHQTLQIDVHLLCDDVATR